MRRQVPLKTFAEWGSLRPGFLEIDLVAYCGSTSTGPFLFTLSTVDVATGWALRHALLQLDTALAQLRPGPAAALARAA